MRVIDRFNINNPRLLKLISQLQYLHRRSSDEKITQVAGNITYTVILGLVPAIAVALAIFTRFPQFHALQKMIEMYFTRGMIPPGMAKGILGNLSTFANKAAGISIVSSIAMFFTTSMMFNLIETTFNRIWGVKEPRPIFRRFVMYLFIATLGPLLFGGSLYVTSYLYLVARGIVGNLPYLNGIWPLLFLTAISTTAFTFLYRFVPYRQVLWKDAFLGGLFASIAFEVAKRLFAIFVVQFASYQKIYGAIALIPMFFLWLYFSSLIMLFGALISSSLPDFRSGRWNRAVNPGSQYADALFIIRLLISARSEKGKKLRWSELQNHVSLSNAELENMLISMQKAGWVRYVPSRTRLVIRRNRKALLRALDEWRWAGNAAQITLADVFARFIFHPDEKEPVSLKITDILEKNLNQSLADYFETTDKSAISDTPDSVL